MQAIARGLIRLRHPLLAAAIILTLALLPISMRTQFDRSIRSFFDENNPQFLTYNEIQVEFGGDTVCLAVYPDPDVLSRDGMERLARFSDELAAIPGVIKVQSLPTMPLPGSPLGTIGGAFKRPTADIEKLRSSILAAPVYRNQFVDATGTTGVALVLVDPEAIASGLFTTSLIRLRELTQARGGHIVGAPVMINDVYDYLEQDSWILTNVSSWAMVGVILALFRRIRWMILPIFVVQSSLVWIKAMMHVFEIQLSLTGAMTTAMVTVIGIASAIHLAVRFREECWRIGDLDEALETTLTQIIPPIFWACATTAVGFGALAISQVAPVRSFGLVMAAASMAVFVAVITIMPGGILLGRDIFGVVPRRSFGEHHLSEGLHWVVSFVGRHARFTTFMALVVLAICAYGFRWLSVETDFTKNFKESSIILQGYRFVEDRLEGAGLIDVVIESPKDLNPAFQDQVRSLEGKLQQIPGVTKVTSLVDMVDMMNVAGMSRFLRTMASRPELKQFWNTSTDRMRIVLRVKEQQATSGKEELIRLVQQTADEAFPGKAQVTGLYVLLVYLIDSLLADQWTALFLSSAGNFLMMALAFRSWRMGIVAFLPNLIPIIMTVGAMGWMGWKINVATAMIQSISMGMAVDFSIHYLYRYNYERRSGLDFYAALDATHRSTGQAMVFADMALILGFGILTMSHFLPTIHFGLLVSLAMLGGLVGNLVMLPVLLRVFYRIGPPKHEQELALESAMRSD